MSRTAAVVPEWHGCECQCCLGASGADCWRSRSANCKGRSWAYFQGLDGKAGKSLVLFLSQCLAALCWRARHYWDRHYHAAANQICTKMVRCPPLNDPSDQIMAQFGELLCTALPIRLIRAVSSLLHHAVPPRDSLRLCITPESSASEGLLLASYCRRHS